MRDEADATHEDSGTSVLLVRPLCARDEQEFAEPLGLERLAGYLRTHGVPHVHVFDRRLRLAERQAGLAPSGSAGFFEEVRQAFPAGRAPNVVGISLMAADDVTDARRVMSRLHEMYPSATFQAGGVYVTTNPHEAARLLPRGTVLQRGEGEAALLALAQERREPARNGTGHALVSPDEWAFAHRKELVRYARLGCAVNMQTSRGCVGRCAFCATPQLPGGLGRWRPRDLRLVADEIEMETTRLEEAGLPAVFNFVDDDFGPLARVEELACVLEDRKLRVAFSLEMRMASLVGQPNLDERLQRVHDAGLTRLFVGVESLNPQTLRAWNKPYDLGQLPRVLKACRGAGIAVQPGYILWHSNQSVAGALREVRQLRELGIYSHRAALSRLVVFPGCALAKASNRTAEFQSMGSAEERFFKRFARETTDLTRRWTTSAIAEPYEVARAFLLGERSHLDAIRSELAEVNDRSYALLVGAAEV